MATRQFKVADKVHERARRTCSLWSSLTQSPDYGHPRTGPECRPLVSKHSGPSPDKSRNVGNPDFQLTINAFVGTNPTDEPITSGLPVTRDLAPRTVRFANRRIPVSLGKVHRGKTKQIGQ